MDGFQLFPRKRPFQASDIVRPNAILAALNGEPEERPELPIRPEPELPEPRELQTLQPPEPIPPADVARPLRPPTRLEAMEEERARQDAPQSRKNAILQAIVQGAMVGAGGIFGGAEGAAGAAGGIDEKLAEHRAYQEAGRNRLMQEIEAERQREERRRAQELTLGQQQAVAATGQKRWETEQAESTRRWEAEQRQKAPTTITAPTGETYQWDPAKRTYAPVAVAAPTGGAFPVGASAVGAPMAAQTVANPFSAPVTSSELITGPGGSVMGVKRTTGKVSKNIIDPAQMTPEEKQLFERAQGAFKKEDEFKHRLRPGVDIPLPENVAAQRMKLNAQRAQVLGLSPVQLNQVQTRATALDNHPIVKDFNVTANQYTTAKKIVEGKMGGPGDLAIVYQFMKALDPTSVVRESEYASASKAGNIFAGAFARFNGYLRPEGGFLPPQVKDAFVQILNQKVATSAEQVSNLYKDFGRRIDRITGRNDGTEWLTNPMDLLPNLRVEPPNTSGGITVQYGGKTYSFPNQLAADRFKADMGIK